jgi:hypothetical protein
MPEPCDLFDKRNKKCTEYGELDPDFTVEVTGNKCKNNTEKVDNVFQELSAKYDQMEANHAQVQDSVGKLTDEMAKLMKMVATLTKVGPNPAASLADTGNPQLGATAAPQHVPVVPHTLATDSAYSFCQQYSPWRTSSPWTSLSAVRGQSSKPNCSA